MSRGLLLACLALSTPGASAAPAKPFGLSVKAYQNSQKQTDVILEVSALKELAAPSAAKHIQLKSLDTEGNLRWTKNEMDAAMTAGNKASSVTLSYNDMDRQQKVQAQVQVQTGESTKTEVLRASAPVLLRPDLTVESIKAPEKIRKGTRLNLGAVIHELKGDLEASAKVLLKEGDVILDEANVDVLAFGNVGAVFSVNLETVGLHTLQVVVTDVTPGDYDNSNNSKEVVVEVVSATESVPFYMYYHNYVQEYQHDWASYWGNGSFKQSGKFEYFYEQLLPSRIEFPLKSMQMEFIVDGTSVKSFVSTDFAERTERYENGLYFAVNTSSWKDLSSDYWFYAYKYTAGYDGVESSSYSSATFSHWAGDYVYYSRGHDNYYNRSWDYSGTVKQGTFLDARTSIKTHFLVEDSQKVFGGAAEMSLSPFSYDYPWNYTWSESFFSRGHNRASGVTGRTSGLTETR